MAVPAGRPLIVGSGIAGLYVALRCREAGLRPTVITKSRLEESNTRYAQGGIAAALGPDDTVALHLRDTVRAGAGIVNIRLARILTSEAPRRIADLVRYGVPFDTVEGQIALGREAAHSRARIVHAGGDATGLRIEETLRTRAVEAGVDARERTVLRAIRRLGRGIVSATVSRPDGSRVEELDAAPLVLATGGAGSLFRHSSNPRIATGEGVAIAFRAGALVQDMEFIQFHPTAFCHPRAPRYLLTEALRGEGAVIRDGSGVRFLPEYDRAAELAPRDVVTRAIHDRMVRTGAGWVYLDATSIPSDRLFARFPTICRFLAEYAIDPSRQWIPVAPAAHYMIGGVATDASGRTTVPGLLACGEAAATGVHGANRLASNSLLEGLVFGERVAALLRHPRRGAPRAPPVVRRLRMVPGDHAAAAKEVASGVRELLWSHVGITRDAAGLSSSLARLEAWARQVEPSSREDLPRPEANAVLMARLVAEAAFSREESRGAHFRSDYPRPNPTWRRHLGLRAGSAD